MACLQAQFDQSGLFSGKTSKAHVRSFGDLAACGG